MRKSIRTIFDNGNSGTQPLDAMLLYRLSAFSTVCTINLTCLPVGDEAAYRYWPPDPNGCELVPILLGATR